MSIICHPRSLEWLKTAIARRMVAHFVVRDGIVYQVQPGNPAFSGIPVYANPLVEEFAERWEPPADPFVTYEPSDEAWCRYFGIGRMVRERIFYRVDLPAMYTNWRAAFRPEPLVVPS